MSVSMEEFGKLQMTMMELKQAKMTLEDSERRQRTAAESAMAMFTESEKQLIKANKIIAKSKKTKDLQAVLQKHEEELEQLTAQNTGLMNNLAELSTANEKMEKRLRRSSISSIEPATPELKLVHERCTKLEDQIAGFLDSEKAYKAKVAKLEQEAVAAQAKYALALTDDNGNDDPDNENGQKDSKAAIDKLTLANKELLSLSAKSEQRAAESAKKIEELEEKLLKLESGTKTAAPTSGNQSLSPETRAQIKELNQKIKKKQASYLALQEEKEKIYLELTTLKEKVAQEADNRVPNELEEQIVSLKQQLAKEKAQSDKFVSEIETLAVAKAKKAAEATESSSELSEIRAGYDMAASELSELRKVAESRKDLLNSQANEKQDMIKKHNEKYSELEEKSLAEVVSLKEHVGALTAQVTKSQKDISKIPALQEELAACKTKISDFEQQVETATTTRENLIQEMEEKEASLKATSEEAVQELTSRVETLETDLATKQDLSIV
eukprot:m.176812 g.176812  ORF g.176812 m.176812 type:complete len:498 (-) comp31859_c2_seq1:1113-2606(-)